MPRASTARMTAARTAVRFRAWLACVVLSFTCAVATPAAVRADDLEDRLKEHVVEGVERSKAKKKKKKAAEAAPKPSDAAAAPAPAAGTTTPATSPADDPATTPAPAASDSSATDPAAPTPDTATAAPATAPDAAKPAQEPDVLFSFSSDDDVEPEKPEKPKGPKLPVRVLGEDVKLDITVGAGYRGWYPQQYDSVEVDIASYFTWNVDLKAKLFKFLTLRRGYYESNGVSAPRTEEAAVAAQIGAYAPKAAWLLGVIGIPISKAWEPQIRYESRAFDTEAVPQREVCIVPRGGEFDLDGCMGTTEPLKIISTFETFVAGVRYDHGRSGNVVVEQKGSKIPPVFFGVGLMQYRKPYQVNVDGFVLEELLFNGRFRGAGLALGADFVGGLDQFFGDVDVQIGLGEVSLTDELTLNEIVSEALPTDPLIGYVQGAGGIGYRWPMIRAAPTLILVPQVRVGGASFFLVNTETEQGEESTSPSVNWDLFWTVQLSLLIPL
jgi:hypothetical protein